MRHLAPLLLLAAAVVAQEPAQPDPDAAWKEPLQKALGAQVTLNLNETPLAEAVAMLRDLTGVNLVLDPDAPGDLPVSAKVERVTVKQAIDRLLEGHDLQPRLWCGVVIIVPAGKGLDAPPRAPAGSPLERKLDGRVTLNFDGTPFEEVLAFLRDITRLSFEAPGAEALPGVSMAVRNVTVGQALTLATYLAGVSWRADGETIRIEAPPCHSCGQPRARGTRRCGTCNSE